MYSIVARVDLRPQVGSDWYGRRISIPSASASAPSSSGAVEAPVHTPMRKSSPRAWSSDIMAASARGTALG